MYQQIETVRVAVAALAMVMVSGCANYWLKPGATKQSFDDDRAQCTALAYLAEPNTNTPAPLNGGYTMRSSAACAEYGNTINCSGYPGIDVTPTAARIDTNKHARTAMVDACMRGQGYIRINLGIGGGAATITQPPVAESATPSE